MTNEFINQLDFPEWPIYGVMVNGNKTDFIASHNFLTRSTLI